MIKEKIKNNLYICADAGSCHMGKLSYCMEFIYLAKKYGIDCVKFQLGTSAPNINLPFDMFKEVFEEGKKEGISVTASIFDPLLINDYIDLQPDFIKFAYSQKDNQKYFDIFYEAGIPIVASADFMTLDKIKKADIKLFCIPSYPVHYEIHFDESIFNKFNGFSDHTLGFKQSVKAIARGAQWIEKHVTLNHANISCPDNNFAVTMDTLQTIKDCWLDVKETFQTC